MRQVQACSQVFRFGGQNTFSEGKIFVLFMCFNERNSGRNRVWGAMPQNAPRDYGPGQVWRRYPVKNFFASRRATGRLCGSRTKSCWWRTSLQAMAGLMSYGSVFEAHVTVVNFRWPCELLVTLLRSYCTDSKKSDRQKTSTEKKPSSSKSSKTKKVEETSEFQLVVKVLVRRLNHLVAVVCVCFLLRKPMPESPKDTLEITLAIELWLEITLANHTLEITLAIDLFSRPKCLRSWPKLAAVWKLWPVNSLSDTKLSRPASRWRSENWEVVFLDKVWWKVWSFLHTIVSNAMHPALLGNVDIARAYLYPLKWIKDVSFRGTKQMLQKFLGFFASSAADWGGPNVEWGEATTDSGTSFSVLATTLLECP